MNSESVPQLCPRCCGPVPADAPQGLCPRCVLAQAVAPAEAGARSGTRLTPPPLSAVAAAFPQFEILELIGVGGMGVVYKARQPKLERIVALKLLPQSPSADPAFAERFHREARFLARLTHPHIVSVFDFGESGGFCFLLMEFVDGVNLRQAMQAGRFSPAQALAIVPDICAALQYAHSQGVLHRDIKPENILLDAQGRVKIADFGIAKLVGDPGDPRTDLTLTQSGARLGTPHYMAPEQIEKPSDVDHRADIYSLGVVFYELLTGELPLGRFAAPSAKTALDARVDEIVMRALAKERELRQQSAGEMKTQVETVVANPQSTRPEAAQPFAPSGLLKVGTGTLTTPERFATFAGQFSLHRTRGPLILDRRQLTHTCAGVTTVIPLAAIRDLSIGHYPRSVNPVGLDFISVTYGEGGQAKRVFLSPMDSIVGLPSRFNQQAAEWFHTIFNAVGEATGRTPGTTPAERLGTPAGSKAIYGLFLLPMAIGAGFVSLVLYSGPPHGPFMQFLLSPTVLVGGTALAILWAFLWAFKATRRAPEAASPAAPVTRDAQPEAQAAQATQAAAMGWPADYEYRSPRKLFGRPLVHVVYGTDPLTGQARVARGIIAMGQKAIGVVAIGGYARGLIAIGGVAIGGLAFGGLGLGLFVIAGLALGLVSVGGLSIGLLLALGGGALGLNAGGGVAIGKFAAGGLAFGKAIWDARHHDEAAKWIIQIIQAPLFSLALVVFSLAAAVIPAAVGGWMQWHRHRGFTWTPGQPPGVPVPTLKARRIGPWIFLGLLIALVLAATLPLFLFIPSKTFPKFQSSAEEALVRLAPNLLTHTLIKSGASELEVEYRFGSQRQLFLTTEWADFRQSVRLLPADPSTNGTWVHPFEARIRLRLTPSPDGGTTYLDITTTGVEGSLVGEQQVLNVRFPELARAVVKQLPTQRPIRAEQEDMLVYSVGLALRGTLTQFPESAPTTNAVVSSTRRAGTNLPTLASVANRRAAFELQYAQNRLAEAKKMAEVGAVAPQGREVLNAEVAVAEAEAKIKGDPRIGFVARLKRAELLCTSALKRVNVGAGTTAELEQEQLEQAKVRTDLAETLQRGTTNAAELKWLTAWSQFSEEQVKVRTGRTSPLQYSLAIRNLKVAEAELLHQPLWAALAREEYCQSLLAWKRREFADGQVSKTEVDSAEQLLKQAEEELREVERPKPPGSTVAPSGTGKVQPILGEGGKFAWLPGQPLLQPAEAGQAKADSPQPAAPAEPAKPVTDYSGVVRFYGSVNQKIELPAKRPTRLANAIMDLGQLGQFANLKKVKVHHADGSSEVVDVAKAIAENIQDQDLILRDGDRVEIRDKTIQFFDSK